MKTLNIQLFHYCLILLLFSGIHAYSQPSCSGIWGPSIIRQTFGQGNATNNWYGPLADYAPGVTTSTIFVGAAGPTGGTLADGYSGLAKTPSASNQGNWLSTGDHTGDPNGLLFLINAPSTAATVFFEYTMDSLCPNTTLRLSVWILNVNNGTLTSNPTYQYPNMTLKAVNPATDEVLGTAETGNIPADSTWHQHFIIFNNGTGSSVKLQLINNSVGSGYGNDLALDDIMVEPCVPVSGIFPKLDTLVCENTTFSFDAQVLESPYNPAEFQWQYSTNNGMTWIDQGPPTANSSHVFNANTSNPGTYWIRFKTGPKGATSNSNCIAISDTAIVIVSDPPVPPLINYTKDICTGSTFEGFDIASGTNIKWYNDPADLNGSSIPPTVNTTSPGNYRWFASQTTEQGCESGRIPIEVNVIQTPKADFDFNIRYGCSEDTVYFENKSIDAKTFSWNFGNNFFDTSRHARHIYKVKDNYSVVLTAMNDHCADSITKIIDLGHPLQAGFITSADTVCETSAVEFTNTSTASALNNIAPVYFWDFGDGNSSTLQNPTHIFEQPGIYNVMMVVTNAVPCSDTAYRMIFVDSLPALQFTQSDTAICVGDKIRVEAFFTESGLNNVLWDFGDAFHVSNVNEAQHAYEDPGIYTITLAGTYRICPDTSMSAQIRVKPMPAIDLGSDTSICLNGSAIVIHDYINQDKPGVKWLWSTGDTTSFMRIKHYGKYTGTIIIDGCSTTEEIIVDKDCFIDLPNSFTPNGDGINDYFFPRQLQSSGLTSFTMHIFNRWGQKVFESSNPSGRGWDGKFNEKEQPAGVYIYRISVEMKNGRIEEYTGNVTLLR